MYLHISRKTIFFSHFQTNLSCACRLTHKVQNKWDRPIGFFLCFTGLAHPQIKIIYSTSCCSRSIWLTFLFICLERNFANRKRTPQSWTVAGRSMTLSHSETAWGTKKRRRHWSVKWGQIEVRWNSGARGEDMRCSLNERSKASSLSVLTVTKTNQTCEEE